MIWVWGLLVRILVEPHICLVLRVPLQGSIRATIRVIPERNTRRGTCHSRAARKQKHLWVVLGLIGDKILNPDAALHAPTLGKTS